MPIVLNDDNKVSVLDVHGSVRTKLNATYSPKFFHKSVLTGKGGQSKGLLNENRDPKMFKNGYPVQVNPNIELGTTYNKDIKIYNIPCYIISQSLWDKVEKYNRPATANMTKIATKGTEEIYMELPLHAIQVEETQVPGPAGSSVTTTKRALSACMHLFVYSIKDHNNVEHTCVNHLSFLSRKGNLFYQDIIWNIFTSLRNVEHELTSNGYTVDKDAMNDFVQNYSLYTELCKAAERWQEDIDYYIADVLCKNINDYTGGKPDYLWTDARFSVAETLANLEKYSVPLDKYQSMYDKMQKILPTDILSQICKSNLNLRLSNTLQHMDNNRANLEFCPCNVHVQHPKIPYSKEQIDAIESTSPLTLVQSGAGTGKSTVILGRIAHMIANGINPEDITVLSFTNAAANHIKDMMPDIHSMTIAYMLHTIYSTNFPTHELSSLSTIINSLEIYYPPSANIPPQKQDFIWKFNHILERLRDNNEYTKANNFVEDHIDEVIDVLDTIQQTSLELESIICYQKMDTLVEPPETKTKHLIIDEVQDNSIAEFIYSIRYTDKHCCSMYIVGDCSQTLYEFRASNPKALNVLESSGVFEIHKLQTNYRSNQEILDFANVLLNDIEANQYANIQLKANSLKPVTLQSFTNAVQLAYYRMPDKSNATFDSVMAHSIVIEAKNYIDDKMAKNEQVCILASTRRELHKIREVVEKTYPGKNIASLIPHRQNDATPFSKFIARYWDTITYTPPMNILDTIKREINAKAVYMSYRNTKAQQAALAVTQTMLSEFEAEHGAEILNWQQQVQMSVMTQLQMLDEIKKLMISFEIKRNSKKQAIVSSRNAEAKLAADIENADFVFSTIHSAKGLEFDNVLVYYQSESESNMDEATKRAYYVALTRAKQTEFIFAYDKAARPKIQGDYDTIIKTLTAQAQNQAAKSTSSTNTVDDDEDDDATVIDTTTDDTVDTKSANDDVATTSVATVTDSPFVSMDTLSEIKADVSTNNTNDNSSNNDTSTE